MTDVSFSRFFKLRTGKNLSDYIIDIRLGFASRLLVDSTMSIAEICYECGFNNLSNFNRIFKRRRLALLKNFVRTTGKRRSWFKVRTSLPLVVRKLSGDVLSGELVPPACHSCAIVVSELCQADVRQVPVTGRCHILALSLSVV